ncbi:actin binding protein [Coniosporium apollinis]|uniref:Actin binding protein n=1 Tax=Coniosporium apollinis TaxID=61459 RepID=A0ABQ9P4E5_9PEZI|nr:actin binding protein [Coniosporium apollinis]
MASLNLSSNGPSITRSYQSIVNSPPPSGAAASSPTYGQWAVFSVAAPLVSAFQQDSGKESVLKVQSTGEGELVDLIEEFSDGKIQFAFVKVKDTNTTLPKNVLIAWCGEGVPERTKGYFTSHLAAVSKLLHGYHVQVTARSDRDLTPERIIQKVADSSGSKYSGGGSVPAPSGGAPPPTASKPPFTPTRVGGGSSGFNPLGSRSRGAQQNTNVDEDGWGADAPPVTRTQLEKVQPAYKPTKVNISELTSQKQEPSRFNAPQAENLPGDVVRGGYQPIGKVDINAIRRQAKESGGQDDRPTAVKGAYEPVGKVDIAAIRARAQGPSGATPPPRNLSPAVTGSSAREEEREEAPKSLADRSAAFTQPERLTSMPKPKVSNRFGSSASTFAGTKAPTPSGFQSKPIAAAAPVGTASKTFADEGGKTPAQIWAEKKARQRGLSGAGEQPPSAGHNAPQSPVRAQPSGEGGWKSGYSGKSWAPVETTRTGQSASSNLSQQRTGQDEREEEATSSPAGGVGAIRDRFKDAAPMGAPATRRDVPEPESASPPPMDLASKPNAGAARGVPIPGLPQRPQPADEEEDRPAEEHVRLPTPPAQPRSPTPPTPPAMRDSSPVRIAMPVGRGREPAKELEAPEERFSPPSMPVQSIQQAISATVDTEPEPQVEADDPARGAAAAAATTTFGHTAAPSSQLASRRAIAQYDYEKAEDNELELRDGEEITDIEMVDEDWWMGRNSRGEAGLFPSNYVELIEDSAASPPPAAAPATATSSASAPAAPPAAGGAKGPTATALYDYEAAEDNELSFPDGATITGLEFPDEDWWFGEYNGKSGLFPANYVQLNE